MNKVKKRIYHFIILEARSIYQWSLKRYYHIHAMDNTINEYEENVAKIFDVPVNMIRSYPSRWDNE